MKLILVFAIVFSLGVLTLLAESIPRQEDSQALASKPDDPSVNYRSDSQNRLKRGTHSVRWRKVNKWPVCFEAKGNRFGRFYVPGGRLAAIKLVHLYGYVSCHVHGPSFWSYWGCGDNPSMRLNTLVNAVITDSSNHILLPPIQFQKISSLKWYRVPGYNSLSPELVLPFFSSPNWVHSNQELRVWYGENLVKNNGDNGGKVCADVYALFV
ncbi:unnamed protein product [Porites evermanni]|uniref:Uncharacterized protein n=1 Tax=Porites evermanni TaxID=104178 RepID=A0ABN8M185_9CNID|nr:unnamed protein product [Porites evermanni]